MKLIHRNKDFILQNEDLEHLYTFKNFPVLMGCTDLNKETDLFADMSWQISKNSGAIQLNPLLPLDLIYQDQHGSGCVGKLWIEHHKAFAKFVIENNCKTILEIGGLHGILSKFCYELNNELDWTIIEPNPIPEKNLRANFIKGFFDKNFKFDKKVDAIVHSHVIEHIYELHEFMEQIQNFLDLEKKLIFSVPNLNEMLQRKYTNCLNFEHTIFLNEEYLEFILNKYNFEIVKKQKFKDDHSIFYSCIKKKQIVPKKISKNLFKTNKKLFLDYINHHQKLIEYLNLKINNLKKNHKIYLFGAHVFSQYLFNFGLNETDIQCLIDNDTNKQNKRLYGTRLKVFSPKILKGENKPAVILKAGVYNNEIKKDIIENINSETIFI